MKTEVTISGKFVNVLKENTTLVRFDFEEDMFHFKDIARIKSYIKRNKQIKEKVELETLAANKLKMINKVDELRLYVDQTSKRLKNELIIHKKKKQQEEQVAATTITQEREKTAQMERMHANYLAKSMSLDIILNQDSENTISSRNYQK